MKTIGTKMFAASLLLALAAGTSGAAQATVIDFSTISSTVSSGNINKIGSVTFSHNLYSHDDGFHLNAGGAYIYYGENHEYMSFAAPVLLNSLDVTMSFAGLPQATSMTLNAYDNASQLVGSVLLSTSASVQNVLLGINNVSRLQFDFTGGANSYGDGRLHAWYLVDNVSFGPAGQASASVPSSVPEPGSLALLGLGLAGLGFGIRGKQKRG
jgi:hypothetical protein